LSGAIVFSRMSYAGDARAVFVLAPVAVAPDRQGQGVGTALIRHGLDALRARGVDVALTYGDPAYYGRLGFRPITTEIAAAPFRCNSPMAGWGRRWMAGAPPAVGEVGVPAWPIRLSERSRFCPTDLPFPSAFARMQGVLCAGGRPFPMQVLRAIPEPLDRRPAPVRPIIGIIGNHHLINDQYSTHAGGTMNSEAVAEVSGCMPLLIPSDPRFVSTAELLDRASTGSSSPGGGPMCIPRNTARTRPRPMAPSTGRGMRWCCR
jgi:hypothetical protein